MALEMKVRKELAHFELDLELCCPAGTLLALVGPSGSGKTMALRLLAGLERPDMGRIVLNGRVLGDVGQNKWLPPQKRRLGYVFQEASLFPHLVVADNISFACRDQHLLAELMDLLALDHLRRKLPRALSGGERQRVAFAQALAAGPELLLLDEPFSALDRESRSSLQALLLKLKDRFKVPMVMVTHDLDEAALLAGEIVTLERGQTDTGWLARQGFSLAGRDAGYHGDVPECMVMYGKVE
ncbi:MAG: ATP-binding cassette domain-containing protein [Thermodesulfobacteriota bacterium]